MVRHGMLKHARSASELSRQLASVLEPAARVVPLPLCSPSASTLILGLIESPAGERVAHEQPASRELVS